MFPSILLFAPYPPCSSGQVILALWAALFPLRAVARARRLPNFRACWKHEWMDSDGAPLRSEMFSVWCWGEVTNKISCAEVTDYGKEVVGPMVIVERRGRVCSEMSSLTAGMCVYAQHFSLTELSLTTCTLLMWKYGNSHCLWRLSCFFFRQLFMFHHSYLKMWNLRRFLLLK